MHKGPQRESSAPRCPLTRKILVFDIRDWKSWHMCISSLLFIYSFIQIFSNYFIFIYLSIYAFIYLYFALYLPSNAGYTYARPGGRNGLEIGVKQHINFKSEIFFHGCGFSSFRTRKGGGGVKEKVFRIPMRVA